MSVPSRTRVSIATAEQRERIRRLRHEVYATELGQHQENALRALSDELDEFNVQIVASCGDDLVGFVTITPAGSRRFSIDKYFKREELPFEMDEGAHEVRLLTVPADRRGSRLAAILMLAAFRWIEARGGHRVVAIGRQQLRSFYVKAGLEPHGLLARSGRVTYELMSATIDRVRGMERHRKISARIGDGRSSIEWDLDAPLELALGPDHCGHLESSVSECEECCFHGGAAFAAIGERFERVDRHESTINADVLDAWFPPAPGVLRVLQEYLAWSIATAPPQDARGVVREISECRGLPPESISVGAGSSALIHRALRLWFGADTRVLLPDPTYGEYDHVLSRLIGCKVERMELRESEGFRIDPERVIARCCAERIDLLILVNPNNPTGQLLSRSQILRILASTPRSTRIWIDEAYIDFEAPDETLESIAAHDPRLIVCKSLSKAHALSGLRVAYLCAHQERVREIRHLSPPWEIGLPAQMAAIEALRDSEHARRHHAETVELRRELMMLIDETMPELTLIGEGANWLLLRLPPNGPDARALCADCARRGLFIRDAGRTSRVLGTHTIRIAVKQREVNRRMVAILADAMRSRMRTLEVRASPEEIEDVQVPRPTVP
ncbi:MAG: histidinol-phosphate aminotransferase family protein [Phycisphaeraceae bacterium]|nr:histidinol-phosphate aminotransferase family protein [Phycisphaeraceae bacterium]